MESAIFDRGFFEKLNTLKMSLSMHLDQGMSGIRKSGAKGSSVEFSDFREYMLGDDIRRIDWNAYGRTDKLYIKQFMEEKEGRFQIFIDTSKSMCFGEIPKSTMALQVAGALSYIILNNLDRVYIHEMKENSVTQGKGVTGASAFPHILAALNRIFFDGRTTLNKTILSRPVAVGGVSVIISDFLDKEGIEEAVKYLAYKKQTIVLIQILSKEERQIAYEGTVNILDVETGERVKITMSNATIRQYGEQLQGLQESLKTLAGKYGADYIFMQSDDSLIHAMLHGFYGILQGK
ncbi:MAG: DUF58 domain-containing protein [Lachnospiraceae bacterium]|nr:DUF58 domain-containing protein [Lachnospiraceae bacterium]